MKGTYKVLPDNEGVISENQVEKLPDNYADSIRDVRKGLAGYFGESAEAYTKTEVEAPFVPTPTNGGEPVTPVLVSESEQVIPANPTGDTLTIAMTAEELWKTTTDDETGPNILPTSQEFPNDKPVVTDSPFTTLPPVPAGIVPESETVQPLTTDQRIDVVSERLTRLELTVRSIVLKDE